MFNLYPFEMIMKTFELHTPKEWCKNSPEL